MVIRNKKGEVNWFVVMLILALILFVVFSFISKGIVYNFVTGTTSVSDDTNLRLKCIAKPGSGLDKNGDGYVDETTTITVNGQEEVVDCSSLNQQ